MTSARETKHYATPSPRATRNRQRVLYCLSLPLIAFGLGMAHDGREAFISACIMGVGALLLACALPLRGEGVS